MGLRGRARALTGPGGLLAGAALVLCALPVTSAVRDPDFWWHLRTGQLIAAGRGLLGTDPFTYTVSDHHWVMHEWLTELIFAGLYAAGGLAAVVVVLSVVTWLGLLLTFLRSRLRSPHYLPLAGGMLLAAVAGYPIWGPRAQMITFALTCVMLYLVERHLRRGGRAVWWLVPLFLIWGNLHSGFIIGVAFLALILGAEAVGGRLGAAQTADPARVRTLGRVLVASLAVIVVNPNGPAIYLYPFETQGSGAQQELILEWHSPDFHQPELAGFLLMVLTLVVMVTASRRIAPRDGVLALATTALALQSVRHVALFVAAVTPLWIEQAHLCGARWLAWRAALGDRRPSLPGGGAPVPALFRIVAALVIAALGAAAATRLAVAASTREDSLYYTRDFPVCAARWLAQPGAPGGLRIFNQYGEGGYLADKLSARGDRVYIFGDAALMGDDLLVRYGDVESVRPVWERRIDEAGTDLVLFDTGVPLSTVLAADTRWVRVYSDPRTVGFVRAGSPLLERLPPPPSFPAGSTDVCAALSRGGLPAR